MAIQLVGDKYTSPYAFGPELSTLLGNEAILRRASPGWLEKYIDGSVRVESLFREHLLAACECGELSGNGIPKELLVDEIVTCIWSMCVGHTQVQMQRSIRNHGNQAVRLESDSTIVHGLQRLLNTYTWKTPLNDTLTEETCRLLKDHGLR